MKFYAPLILCIIVLFSACSENTFSVPPVETTPDWNAFDVTQTYYDSLEVTSENRILLPDRNIQSVVLLTELSGQYIARDTAMATYVATNGGYFLNYSLKGRVSDRSADLAFRIRYQNDEGSIAIVDSSEFMLDYAYENVEIYITAQSLESGTNLRNFRFQDFDLTLNSIFFHPIGLSGIYNYRYNQLRSDELVEPLAGNYIAVLQNVLFFEAVNVRLFRIEVLNATQPQELDLSAISYTNIRGLAGWQDKLFILFDDPSGNFLGIFDIDGNLLETIDFRRNCFHLAISPRGILYTNEYGDIFEPNTLVRFDLNSETFLDDKIHPGYNPLGMRIWGDKFFFTDYPKQVLATMPLSELEN